MFYNPVGNRAEFRSDDGWVPHPDGPGGELLPVSTSIELPQPSGRKKSGLVQSLLRFLKEINPL